MLPHLEAFLLCEEIEKHSDDDVSLIHVQETVPWSPTTQHTAPCKAYLKFRAVRGFIDPVLRFIRVDSGTGIDEVLADIKTVRATNRHGVGPTVYTVSFAEGIPLAQPGEYRLQVLIDGQEVGQTRFVAME